MNGQIIANDDWKPPIDISCKDMMILVVDDDHTSLSVIGGILKSWKYNVETVRSGGEALSILRCKQDKRFDLVVTDIHMPDMNGFELLRRISIDFQVPIVMMSSDDSEKIMTKGLECGASYFMRKPVCPKDLQNLWLYVIPKKNQDSSPGQMIVADTNNTPKSHGNSTIQQVAGSSAHSTQILSQGPWPITQYMQQRTVALVEKHQEENRRRKKTRNLNQTPKVTATVPPLNYPASVFANRKPKVAWFTGLHNKFLDALKIIGLGRAVPKKILEVMNVPGLTRENVASHLQKYRIFLKKIADVAERGDGMSKPSKSKFALSYLPMPFGLDLENLDDADDNLLRKKLKQELRAIRDPIYMGPSWKQYGTILPNNNAGNTSAPFTSNYPFFPLEPNKQMSVAGLVELGGTGCTNEGQAAPERNNYEMTRENIRGNNSNANSQMITGQQPSAFVPYGMNMISNSSEARTGGLVNNCVPQVTNNLGNGYGVESQNSGMVMSQGIFCNAIMQNALKLLNANSESGNGYVYDMSNNSDISGFQGDFSEHLIQQLGGGDHTSNSLEQARNPFLAFSGSISGQVQLQNKIQESEPIPNQQDSSYFGEDFNPWFDQEPIQTQAGNQTANMLITDELFAMCQGFRGEALSSLQNGSPKKSDTP